MSEFDETKGQVFKAGDIVRCVHSDDYHLNEGDIYEVIDTRIYGTTPFIDVLIGNVIREYWSARFEIAEDAVGNHAARPFVWYPIEQYDPKIHPKYVLGCCGEHFFTTWQHTCCNGKVVWMSDSCHDFGGRESPTHFMIIDVPAPIPVASSVVS